jgi:hypothetical protein
MGRQDGKRAPCEGVRFFCVHSERTKRRWLARELRMKGRTGRRRVSSRAGSPPVYPWQYDCGDAGDRA